LELLYTTLLYLIQPLVWLRLLLRSRKAPAYRKRWAERYGFCQNKVEPDGILLHSVSVGETWPPFRWFAPCATATLLCRSPSPP
jgi:3-deoxy-D-manno-octulosonic-acid transferase